MTRLFKTTDLCACAILAFGAIAGYAGPALAQDDATDRLAQAWQDAIGDQEPILTQQQFAAFNNLAFQAAATRVCDGYDLDPDKLSQAMADAMKPSSDAMSEEESKQWATAAIFRFGTTYGLFLAEGNAKPDGFCASAKELKADGSIPNVWK